MANSGNTIYGVGVIRRSKNLVYGKWYKVQLIVMLYGGNIDSGNGLSLDDLLSTGLLGTNFSEI